MKFFDEMNKTIAVWKEPGPSPKTAELKKLAKRIGAAIHAGADEALVYIQVTILPEILVFLKNNMALAMKICVQIAKDSANNPNMSGSYKRELAMDRVKAELPNVNYGSSWVGLLIELAVVILKSTKTI